MGRRRDQDWRRAREVYMNAIMGAWGEKAFENDSALDWLAGLEVEGVLALRDVLCAVAKTDESEYLDVDDGATAIAAAEIVAAAVGKGRERVPRDLLAWLDTNGDQIVMDDVVLARRAVERVLGSRSELRELWEEGGVDTSWHSDVGELLRRLSGEPVSSRRNTPRDPTEQRRTGAGKRAQHQQWKSALLAFAQFRGLKPDELQLERILASHDEAEIRKWLARVVSASSIAEILGE